MLEELKTRLHNQRVFSVTEKTCNEVLQRGAKVLGLPVHLTNHSLRHIFASNLVKNRVPIQLVSRLLRHSSVEITDKTYTHLNVNDLSQIINGRQSIVKFGLSPEQIFDNLEFLILDAGFKNDSGLKYKISRNDTEKKLIVEICLT